MVIEINPVVKLKVCVVSRFEPLGLRCEMTVNVLRAGFGNQALFSMLSSGNVVLPESLNRKSLNIACSGFGMII